MSQINDLQKLEKVSGKLSQRLGRSPTAFELAEQVDISAERTRNAMDSVRILGQNGATTTAEIWRVYQR